MTAALPTPAQAGIVPGARVRLRRPILGATHGTVVAVGRCGHPTCGAGDRCVTVHIVTSTAGTHHINRTPTDLTVEDPPC